VHLWRSRWTRRIGAAPVEQKKASEDYRSRANRPDGQAGGDCGGCVVAALRFGLSSGRFMFLPLFAQLNRLAFRRLQSVDLQLWGLVRCGDSRIADDHCQTLSHTLPVDSMIVIMSFDRNAIAKRQVKNWRLEHVRNGAHRHDRETRCGKIQHQRFVATEITCPRCRLYRQVEPTLVNE
jgi:hypothetical protein